MIYTYIDLLNSPIMGTFLWLQFQGHFFSVSESLLIVNNPNNPCQDKLACSINLREDLRYLAVTYFVVGVNSSKTLGTPTNLDIHHRSIVKGLKLGWKGLYVVLQQDVRVSKKMMLYIASGDAPGKLEMMNRCSCTGAAGCGDCDFLPFGRLHKPSLFENRKS